MKRIEEERERVNNGGRGRGDMRKSCPSFTIFSPFFFHHVFKPGQHLLVAERTEAKPGAARLEGGDDVGQVVADQTEPHVVRELLNHYEEKVRDGSCIHHRTASKPA